MSFLQIVPVGVLKTEPQDVSNWAHVGDRGSEDSCDLSHALSASASELLPIGLRYLTRAAKKLYSPPAGHFCEAVCVILVLLTLLDSSVLIPGPYWLPCTSTALKDRPHGPLPMCHPLSLARLGLLRWHPLMVENSEMNWMCDGGKGGWPVDTECPHPRGTLGGTPCPAVLCATRATILIVGLHRWMGSWLPQDRATLDWPTWAEGGGRQGHKPQSAQPRAAGFLLGPGPWRMHELTWVGMEGRAGRGGPEPPIISLLCIHSKSRGEPSPGLQGQSIAIKVCAFLHSFPQLTPVKCHWGKIDERDDQIGFVTSNACCIQTDSLMGLHDPVTHGVFYLSPKALHNHCGNFTQLR